MIAFSALSSVVSLRRWGCRVLICSSSLILAATPVAVGASDHWIGIPAYELAAHRFVAEADDATAVFLNPAGLAGGHGANMYLDLTGTTDEIIEGTAALQGGSWGFAYRHRDIMPRGTAGTQLNGFGISDGPGNLDTYALASSFGKGQLRMGVARVWSNTDLSGEDSGFWRLGLQNRLSRSVSLGAVVEASNKDRFLNGRLRPRYTYGVAIRPLPASPELLTVNIQGSHSDGEADLIDLSYGASIHLNGGLRLGIAVQDPVGGDMEWGGSVTTHFGKGAVSARARSMNGDEDYRALVSLQIYDEFWQQSMTAKKRVAAVDLRGAYKDLASGFVLLGGSTRGTQSLVRRIHHAARDKDISALAIRVGNVSSAFLGPVRAQHEEIRKAINQFQESGKPVVAYLDVICGPTELYLALAADHVVLPPLSGIQGIGVAFHQSRYSRMLENIGVEWDADTSGVYKSTFHGFYTDTTSAAQKEVIQGLVDAMFDHLVGTIQTARGISDPDMDEIATGKILFPEDCLRLGLVGRDRVVGTGHRGRRASVRKRGQTGNHSLAVPALLDSAMDSGPRRWRWFPLRDLSRAAKAGGTGSWVDGRWVPEAW